MAPARGLLMGHRGVHTILTAAAASPYSSPMIAKTESIEIDGTTAAALKQRAAERGVSVAQLVAELVSLDNDDAAIAELDRRWTAIEHGEATVPQADVEGWLRTWGTAEFRPWARR